MADSFDDVDFDDNEGQAAEGEPLAVIGKATALYTFEATTVGSLSVEADEEMNIVEHDNGDGWTRIRRNNGEEGFVPTSYMRVNWETKSIHNVIHNVIHPAKQTVLNITNQYSDGLVMWTQKCSLRKGKIELRIRVNSLRTKNAANFLIDEAHVHWSETFVISSDISFLN